MLHKVNASITGRLIPFRTEYKPKRKELLKGVYFPNYNNLVKRKATLSIFINNEIVIDEMHPVDIHTSLNKRLRVIDRIINEPVTVIFKADSEKTFFVSCYLETQVIDE